MSLSTTTGGGGGMGLSTAAMAHQAGPSAMARIRQAPRVPPGSNAGGPGGVPVNAAALGADQVCDKRLQKLARKTSHLPVVGVDIAGSGHVCYQDPVSHAVTGLGKGLGNDLSLSVGTGEDISGYKVVRKYLTKGNNATALLEQHAISNDNSISNKNKKLQITVQRPHSVLGVRRCSELDKSLKEFYHVSDNKTTSNIGKAIEQVDSNTEVTLQDQAMDGSAPKGDDYDRVSFSVPLHASKKPLTMLPEEAVGMMLLKAKASVYDKMAMLNKQNKQDKTKQEKQEPLMDSDWLESVPVALAVPGYASTDCAMEAFKEVVVGTAKATVGELVADPAALLFPRSACAATAALFCLPSANTNPGQPRILPSKLFSLFVAEKQRLAKRAQADKLPSEGNHLLPLLVTLGVTAEGLELAGMLLVSEDQRPLPQCCDLPIDELRYLHCVNKRFPSLNPEPSQLTHHIHHALEDLSHSLTLTLTSATPFAVLLYADSLQTMHLLETTTAPFYKPDQVVMVHSREDAVAFGAALMAAAACARASPSVQLTTVCTASVGVKISYGEGLSTVKTVFDFDRRLPAGPYTLEFSALEAAAIQAHGTTLLDQDDHDAYHKLLKPFQGHQGIAKREKAALALSVQIVQQSQRGGQWIPLGDVLRPLVYFKPSDTDDDEDDSKKTKIACETANLELRLRNEGILVTSLEQDGVSIVQALKNSRLSTLQWYATLLFCILFFGGFLVKSYWEDAVFQRDTKRVLAYYRRAVPGSMHDGDEHGARYLVYKYRNKKAKLWTRLEKKYDYPIPEDWDAFVAEVEAEKRHAKTVEPEEEQEEENLDNAKNVKTPDEEQSQDDVDDNDEL